MPITARIQLVFYALFNPLLRPKLHVEIHWRTLSAWIYNKKRGQIDLFLIYTPLGGILQSFPILKIVQNRIDLKPLNTN